MNQIQEFLKLLFNKLPEYSKLTEKFKHLLKMPLCKEDQSQKHFLKTYSDVVLKSIADGISQSFSIKELDNLRRKLNDHRSFLEQVYLYKFNCQKQELAEAIQAKLTSQYIQKKFCSWLDIFNPLWLIDQLYQISNQKIFPLNRIIFVQNFSKAEDQLKFFCLQNKPIIKRQIIQIFFLILKEYRNTDFEMFHLVRLLVMRQINRKSNLLGSIEWLWLTCQEPDWNEDELLLRKAIHYQYFQRKQYCLYYETHESIWYKFKSN